MSSKSSNKFENDLQYAKTFSSYVRRSAWICVPMLAFWCIGKLLAIATYPFPWVIWLTIGFCTIYSILLLIPWKMTSPLIWRRGTIAFVSFSFAFVFLLIGNVMVDAVIAHSNGVKLGVPGYEGTLLFLALAQIPGILFERHPEMMI